MFVVKAVAILSAAYRARAVLIAQSLLGDSELRIDYGRGYRVYFVRRGPVVIVLLRGGDKRTQTADIKRAKRMARDLE